MSLIARRTTCFTLSLAITAFAVATTAELPNAQAQPGVAAPPLAWKLSTGDKHRYKMEQQMTTTTDLGAAGTTESTIQVTMEWLWDVASVDEQGNATVKQSIQRMTMDIKADNQQIKIDSADTKKPEGRAAQLAPIVKAMTETVFTVTMTPQGEIANVVVPEELIKRMKAAPSARAMGKLADKKGFEQLVSQATLRFPKDGTLEQGEPWKETTELQSATTGKQVINKTYTYAGPKEVKGKSFEVFNTQLNLAFVRDPNSTGPTINVNKQDSAGEILFDAQRGVVERSSLNQTLNLTITSAAQKMNQQIKQTVSFQRQAEKKPKKPDAEKK